MNLNRIQMRKLKKSLMKQLRNERVVNLYLMNLRCFKDKETEGTTEEETDGENVEGEAVESDE